jgi:hypothetical protein
MRAPAATGVRHSHKESIMRHPAIATILLAACALGAGHAAAEGKACLLEGSFTIGTKTTEVKDCITNDGVAAGEFAQVCDSLAQSTAAMGGPAATVTWLDTCPEAAQASCKGFFGKPMTTYYYKRDAENLSAAQTGCEAQGGSWK